MIAGFGQTPPTIAVWGTFPMYQTVLKVSAGVFAGLTMAAGVSFAAPYHSEATQSVIGPRLQLLQQQQRIEVLRGFFDRLNLRRAGKGSFGVSAIGDTGLSAGDAALTNALSVWASANYNNAENSFPSIAYDADTYGFSLGLDYAASDTVNVGAFLSYANTDTETPFNGGGSDTDAYTVGPYVSVMLNEIFTVDASIGYTFSEIENRSVVGLVTVTGDQDAETWFASANISATKWFENNIGLTGRLGYSYSDSDNEAYVDSTGTPVAATESQLGQLQVAARVSYYTENVLPYIGLTYVNDIDNERVIAAPLPSDDDDEFIANAGATFFGEGPLSGGIDVSYNFGRDDTDGFGIGANVNYRF